MFNSSYILSVYYKNCLTCKVEVNKGVVTFENYIDDPIWLPFGINKTATLRDLDDFYEERCFPKDRVNCSLILRELGLDCYEPELICRKTHGVQFDDYLWLQFSDEPQVCWDDIKLRD